MSHNKQIQGSRVDFASKIGLVLATAGSAVGLGNIWRFPVAAGQGGGGAFLVVYILCVLLLGLPLMVAEFAVGRHAHANTAHAYRKLGRGWIWRNIGRFGVFTGWFILCYYIVVSAWALDYFVDALLGRFEALAGQGGTTAYSDYFTSFVSHPFMPIVYIALFVLMSHLIIVRGVKSGIERVSKVLMPMLFVIMVALAVCSVFTPGAKRGLQFLFQPEWGKLSFNTVLAAMGQAFYSLSLAMGCLCTYASYFKRDTGLTTTALKVSVIDLFVSVMAGVVIFPAVFSANMDVDAGASLVFIALPNVFNQVFGSMPLLGYFVAVMFYFLLVLATLTSVISLYEVPTAYLSEEYHCNRRRATAIITVSVLFIGSVCSLSMGPWDGLQLGGKNVFDLFDYVSGQIFLPVGGLLIAVFVGWRMNRNIIEEQFTNYGTVKPHGMSLVMWLLRWVCPIAILLIFLSGIGAMDAIKDAIKLL